MLGDKPKPKAKGRMCKECSAWYRPSRYRSAGPQMEYCSLRCARKSAQESIVKAEEDRASGRTW